MSPLFCCSAIRPFRQQHLEHEAKFSKFMDWAKTASIESTPSSFSVPSNATYAVQLVRQVNYGPQDWIRYFIHTPEEASTFTEITEDQLISSNFEKLNSYFTHFISTPDTENTRADDCFVTNSFKNFRCTTHNKFFEVNLYQENPINTHHWRSNLARPARDIDIAFRKQELETRDESSKTVEDPSSKTKEEEQRLNALSLEKSGNDKVSAAGLLDELMSMKKETLSSKFVSASSQSPEIQKAVPTLRFLLHALSYHLYPNPLSLLLCLDQTNIQLSLGLDFEQLWLKNTTKLNISQFLMSCYNSQPDHSEDLQLLLKEPLSSVEIQERPKSLNGFYETIKHVLTSDPITNCAWGPDFCKAVLGVLEDGPSVTMLKNMGGEYDKHNERTLTVVSPTDPLSPKLSLHYDRQEDPEDYDDDHCYRDYFHEEEQDQDFTACDKECGYCGHCDY